MFVVFCSPMVFNLCFEFGIYQLSSALCWIFLVLLFCYISTTVYSTPTENSTITSGH